ncbi:hypothetical protein ACFLQ0_04130 [Nitrospinota bacterium]
MGVVSVPLLPTGLWVLAAAMTIVILLIVFGYYLYVRSRVAAVLKDADDVAHLAAEVDILNARKDEISEWIKTQNAELERLTAERQDQELVRAELQRIEQECAVKDQENQALRNEVGELENQRHVVSQTLESMRKEINELEGRQGEIDRLEDRLNELRPQLQEMLSELEERRRELNDAVQNIEINRHRLDAITSEKSSLERQVQELKDKENEAREKADKYFAVAVEAEENAIEQKRVLEGKRKEWAELEVRVDALRDEIRSKEKEIDELNERLGVDEGPVEDGESDSSLLISYRNLFNNPATCLNLDIFPGGAIDEEDEYLILQRFQDRLRDDGRFFSSRVIHAFHTALKCSEINPLTVLAGVSGTGKTLLPYYYARMMGMHSLVMAVQPGWDSPRDMFGFYNYLEKEFKATELSRSLVRMDPYNFDTDKYSILDGQTAHERMLLVLMDEMNLARTEYYFSEFLSKLELRRMVKDPNLASDREQAEIVLDSGPELKTDLRIWVGENVLFVGTMNEDETTQTLSDKVLDRANVLRFGKPDEHARRVGDDDASKEGWPKEYIQLDQWRSWLQRADTNTEWHGDAIKWINHLNHALDLVARPFGYRLQHAILAYVANYPRVNEENRFKLAFADQVEQKIIPKLRGIDLGEEPASQCMDMVEEIISDLGDDELGEAFRRSRETSQSIGMFQWRGVTRNIEGAPRT